MAPAILRSLHLHGTEHDVDQVASAIRRSTEDHMAPAIHRSMLSDVNHVAYAMRRSTSDHMASAIIRSLPVDVTGHVMTGPFTGHWSLTGPVAGHWVVPGNVTGHFMTGPFTGPGTEQDVDNVASTMRRHHTIWLPQYVGICSVT
ncbi:hypothetical protein DPMN_058340 [Dreissena polymorpha]|uniref:Uncharacterized protein n=1 Tax=Dreissena polymorpha TaxID=45954 RepID=A0A9D4C1K1_DREPO|nr:hypothetical protein DPMN_058340 [Dreissena polymorpha]